MCPSKTFFLEEKFVCGEGQLMHQMFSKQYGRELLQLQMPIELAWGSSCSSYKQICLTASNWSWLVPSNSSSGLLLVTCQAAIVYLKLLVSALVYYKLHSEICFPPSWDFF